MQSFVWDKCFVTGLPEVDNQHHRLVDLINHFGEKLTETKVDFAELEGVLKELSDYAHFHFQDEERMMTLAGVDQRHVDLHVEEHQAFLRDVSLWQSGIGPDRLHAASDLLGFLIHWLAYHILGTDQNLARQVESIRSGSTPGDAWDAEEKRADSSTEPLVGALQGLFQQISERNRELVALNQLLEHKVAERTSELSKANAHLEELAMTDMLTGVPNRRHAMRRLNDLWHESTSAGAPLACIMIDIDRFKEVNDTNGHEAGDRVLRELARTLLHTVRSDDVVCRLGGDEFLVICPKTSREGVLLVAEAARRAVSELEVPTGGRHWIGSISLGVTSRNPGMKSYEDLIRAADDAVYAAKRDGRGCVREA